MQPSMKLNIGPGIDEFISLMIETNTSVSLVHGSVLNLQKKTIEVVDGSIDIETPSNK